MSEKFEYTNRLIKEKSPYLLQHAHNPVDWYPWGTEAFQAAKMLDMPIFLSIGYATCHWCHTMAKETFADPEIARLLNETFINVKVDREELPEVDSLYMEFAQSMMPGTAGWPLNVIITPDLQPFFAATYLPPRSSEGLMGLNDLVLRIRDVWNGEERERLTSQAAKIVEIFQDSLHTEGNELPLKEHIEASVEVYFRMADPTFGGLRGAPKFPIGYQPNLLLQYSKFFNDSRALFIAERTLDMMHRGGIYDHLGGGFARYSIDEKWRVPHFEKMLYDNALLAQTYLEAWRLTGRGIYRDICFDIIRYVQRDMSHPGGGFYSAQDADSEGTEGFFYTWSPDEIKEVIGEEYFQLFCDFFDVTTSGDFQGRSVLHTPKLIEEFALEKKLDSIATDSLIAEMKARLLQARNQRPHPSIDDKILCSWNGLMITSVVEAGCAFNAQSYTREGVKAADFLKKHLWKDGKLLRRWRDGQAQFDGTLEDYAFLIRALLTLFEADYGLEWFVWAKELTNILKKKFKAENGAFYQSGGEDPSIILRSCHFSDGAEPSGNAVHCENLLRLYHISGEEQYLEQAQDILRAVKKYLDTGSPGYSYHVLNLIRYFDKEAPVVVVALNDKRDFQNEIRQKLFSSYIPHRHIIWRHKVDDELCSLIPWLQDYRLVRGNIAVYICRNKVCQKALTDMDEIIKAIEML